MLRRYYFIIYKNCIFNLKGENELDNKAYHNNIWFKVIIIALITIFFIIFNSKIFPARENLKNASLEEFTSHLNNRIPLIMKDYDIPGVNLSIIKKGEIVWSNSYGFAELENNKKMGIDSYCRVESISKSVTAWGIMKLVKEGKIVLDEPVQNYLENWEIPNSIYVEKEVTTRLLLSNTAGMPLGTIGVRYNPQEEKPTLKEGLTNDALLRQKPGEGFYYSNTGFNILELLIEEVSGKSFAVYMEEEILMPLQMKSSTFKWNKDINNKIPNGYDTDGKPIPVYVYPDKASGGLFATVEDIAKFVLAGMPDYTGNMRVLDERSINQIYSPVVEINGYYGLIYDYYGFGHFIEELSNGNYAVAHGGQGSGWMTHFQAVPESGDGMIILTNSQRSWPFIGYILRDWADWRDLGPLGIEKLPLVTKYLWITIGVFLFAFLLQGWRLAEDYYLNKRSFEPLGSQYNFFRIIELILSLIILGLLIWEITKPYSFLASVFPLAYKWLGIILFLEGFILLLSSLSPKNN